jgi:hypothetical protein
VVNQASARRPSLGSARPVPEVKPTVANAEAKLTVANAEAVAVVDPRVAQFQVQVAHLFHDARELVSTILPGPVGGAVNDALYLVRRLVLPTGEHVGMFGTAECVAAKDCSGKDLTGAQLRGQNLNGVDWTGVNLTHANFRNADFSTAATAAGPLPAASTTVTANAVNDANANLSGANLSGADLRDANMTNANLTNANLANANLTGANLTGANLINAILTGTNLTNVNLTGAKLTGATGATGTTGLYSINSNSTSPNGHTIVLGDDTSNVYLLGPLSQTFDPAVNPGVITFDSISNPGVNGRVITLIAGEVGGAGSGAIQFNNGVNNGTGFKISAAPTIWLVVENVANTGFSFPIPAVRATPGYISPRGSITFVYISDPAPGYWYQIGYS